MMLYYGFFFPKKEEKDVSSLLLPKQRIQWRFGQTTYHDYWKQNDKSDNIDIF